MIIFPEQLSIPIRNHKTGRIYTVVRADAVDPTADRISEVVSISNEPEVYDRLFKQLLGGHPYPREKAVDWFRSISEDWRTGGHFRFFVLDASGAIRAACGIKSNDPDGAEMGYLSSSFHTGIMTNAVVAISGAAKAAGFRSLVCRVNLGNLRSIAVVRRAGFLPDETRADESRGCFIIRL
ncbi:GNAT family N-acetyltransferase [Luteolibacter yonseiensis]|uniref:GNAT family N-acetyltransferase n=1 Tax=Luteolibacter yonseiensis TaxID=1144680 RepID=A0A934R4Z8_9BACT|nr:GNAT family N-acetyltransferase [Luteolibacter yonseiensis]MBK1817271.1 GNAT family N-acetyltransferase [Luteolibacter yonseiensis]